jgi:hypothetical protein
MAPTLVYRIYYLAFIIFKVCGYSVVNTVSAVPQAKCTFCVNLHTYIWDNKVVPELNHIKCNAKGNWI